MVMPDRMILFKQMKEGIQKAENNLLKENIFTS
jgi:hypothetical protein